MLTFDDSRSLFQSLANDSTSTVLTFFDLISNQGYKTILSELARPVTEKTATASTVASQQYYQMPPDFNMIKSITLTSGSTVYLIYECESQEKWNALNQTTHTGIPTEFFVRPRFGFSGTEIGLFPIPSAVNTLTIVYEATDKDLSVAAYSTGTVSITSGSATVTGSGTTFTANMVGRYLKVTTESGDGLWYRIASFTSTTVVTLENVYEGSTVAAVTYKIAEAYALPEDLQILPVYYGLHHYYRMKGDTKNANDYLALYTSGLESGRRRYGSKSRSSIVKGRRTGSAGNTYPAYFPTTIS